jgi:hypothetical protein
MATDRSTWLRRLLHFLVEQGLTTWDALLASVEWIRTPPPDLISIEEPLGQVFGHEQELAVSGKRAGAQR